MRAMTLSRRVLGVPPSEIRQVMKRAGELKGSGKDVVNWHIGRPDFDTPAHIKEACTASMARGDVHYSPAAGIPRLREAIAAQTSRERGLPVEPAHVVVTNGGMEAVSSLLAATVQEGDEVVIVDPTWPNLWWATTLTGATPVSCSDITAAAFESVLTERTRAVLVASPGNPTGGVVPMAELQAIAKLCQERDLLVLSDETYNRLYYGEEGTGSPPMAPSIASLPGMAQRTVVLNTFSKTYAMDGWRLGWAVAPSLEMASALERIRYYVSACSPTFTQHAAVAALEGDQSAAEAMREAYIGRRRVLVEGVGALPGVTLPVMPLGAFYVFPCFKQLLGGRPSLALATWLLEQHHIAAIDGAAFGRNGEGHIRIAYSCSAEECAKGVERLAKAVGELQRAGPELLDAYTE